MPEEVALTATEQQQATALEAAFKEEGLEMPTFDAQGQVEKPTQQPASEATEEGNTPDSLPKPVTPAAAEPKEKPAEPQNKVETQVDDGKSKYAKSQERLEKTWTAVNQRKAELDTREQTLAQRESQIKQQQDKFEQQKAQASAKFTPEQYEEAGRQMADRANSYEIQAKGFEKKAEELEMQGDLTGAEQARAKAGELREASIVQKHQANQAIAHGKHLRDNPDPTAQQAKDRVEAAKKEWTIKAATQWPELSKQDSEFQKTVAGHLKALEKDAPELLEFPGIIYHVARLTAAETTAARVTVAEKKLGEAEARVKELELLTSPGGGKAAVTRQVEEPKFHEMTLEQQEAALDAALNGRR